jgi:DNA-directed RNA polymerase subunit F
MISNPNYVDDLSLAEVKKILTEKGKDKELNYEQKMALEHAKLFAKLTPLKAEKLKKELLEMELPNEVATKIVDILPNSIELDLIAEKNKAITEDNKEKILSLVSKYKKEE